MKKKQITPIRSATRTQAHSYPECDDDDDDEKARQETHVYEFPLINRAKCR